MVYADWKRLKKKKKVIMQGQDSGSGGSPDSHSFTLLTVIGAPSPCQAPDWASGMTPTTGSFQAHREPAQWVITHFSDEETQIQREEVTYSRSHG